LIVASKFHQRIAGPLTIAALCFFGGVGLGTFLESEEHASHDSVAAHESNTHSDHADHEGHKANEPAEHSTADADSATTGLNLVSVDPPQSHDVAITPQELATPSPQVNQRGMAGLFFSIYYCMTGVHAFHIIGGMAVIAWLIVKASREEFHSQYFGPVDNVGLYWHLVDFIWIYLFPLLYLIT
jgi:cytochrome c oxidase subunit 3